jgi:phage shock protein A
MQDKPTQEPQPDEPPAEPLAEPTPAAPDVDPGYNKSGVPTFDSVREKIETRYGASLGAAELDAETPEGRSVEEQYEARQRSAAERVKEIRESMHREDSDK